MALDRHTTSLAALILAVRARCPRMGLFRLGWRGGRYRFEQGREFGVEPFHDGFVEDGLLLGRGLPPLAFAARASSSSVDMVERSSHKPPETLARASAAQNDDHPPKRAAEGL